MTTREVIRERLISLGLEHHAEAILNAIKPAVHIKRQRVQDESQIPVGVSKLGGSPDQTTGFTGTQLR